MIESPRHWEKAKACAVRSHRQYRDLLQFAPKALLALAKTCVAHLHSVSVLHSALRADRCAGCRDFGPYLFLPSCERCCWNCLTLDPAFRMADQLPPFYALPDYYGIAREVRIKPDRREFVTARAAMARGLSRAGSIGAMRETTTKRCRSNRQKVRGDHLLMEPPPAAAQGAAADKLLVPHPLRVPDDPY
ncbi:hypothetical protein VTK26DRAFT_8212 [Humicola hyalothermophila]